MEEKVICTGSGLGKFSPCDGRGMADEGVK